MELRAIAAIMAGQMDKNMEHEMEARETGIS